MSTFQTIILALLASVTQILPVGQDSHLALLTKFMNWSITDPTVDSAIKWGTFVGVFFYFIHDWLSIVSSTLQVILLRKKPMTFDERFPFFLIFIVTPSLVLQKYIPVLGIHGFLSSPWTLWIITILIGVWFIRLQTTNRRLKTFFVWNFVDSLAVGVSQITNIIPGVGFFSPTVITGGVKHYHWDAIFKYAFLSGTPFLLAEALEPVAAGGAEWLSINAVLATILATVGSYFAASSFQQTIESRNLTTYGWYRIVLGVVGVGVTLFLS